MIQKIIYTLNIKKKQQNNKKRFLWKIEKAKLKKLFQLKILFFLFIMQKNKNDWLLYISLKKFFLLYKFFFLVSNNILYFNAYYFNIYYFNFNLLYLAKFIFNIHLFSYKIDKKSLYLLGKSKNLSLLYFKNSKKKYKNYNYSFIKTLLLMKWILYYKDANNYIYNNFSLLSRIFISTKLKNLFYKKFYKKNYNYRYKPLLNWLSKSSNLNYLSSLSHNFLVNSKNTRYSKGLYYFFFDNNKSILLPLLLARNVHINFSRKKTLRNVGYKVFLKSRLKKLIKTNKNYFNISYILRSYNFVYNWYICFLLVEIGFIYINGARVFSDKYLSVGDYFQVANIVNFDLMQFFFFFKLKKIKKKLKKISYINYLTSTKLWMKRKKSTTKFFSWLYFSQLSIPIFFLFDYFISTGIYFKKINFYSYNTSMLEYTSTIKLNSWKFRAT